MGQFGDPQMMMLAMEGKIYEAFKYVLRKEGRKTGHINLTYHLFLTPDPENPKEEAIALLVRENK